MLAALAANQDPSYVESYWEILLETSVSSSQFRFNPTEIVRKLLLIKLKRGRATTMQPRICNHVSPEIAVNDAPNAFAGNHSFSCAGHHQR